MWWRREKPASSADLRKLDDDLWTVQRQLDRLASVTDEMFDHLCVAQARQPPERPTDKELFSEAAKAVRKRARILSLERELASVKYGEKS